MKTLIAYFSQGGSTKSLCEQLKAKTPDADLYEICEVKKHGNLHSFLVGIPQVMRKKGSKIKKVDVDTSQYGIIVLASPIWASSPAPAITSFLSQINANNQKIIGVAVSSSGDNYTEGFKERIEAFGGKMVKVYNVKKGGTLSIPEIE